MTSILALFERDLEKLALEIGSFKKSDNLWITEGEVSNSAGNLCLHLVGNLKHFIGSVIGKTDFQRDREAEFITKNIEVDQLIEMVKETKEVVTTSLSNFNTQNLTQAYPIQVFGKDMSYEFFLLHLISHLNYHLGQINYLRRILDN